MQAQNVKIEQLCEPSHETNVLQALADSASLSFALKNVQEQQKIFSKIDKSRISMIRDKASLRVAVTHTSPRRPNLKRIPAQKKESTSRNSRNRARNELINKDLQSFTDVFARKGNNIHTQGSFKKGRSSLIMKHNDGTGKRSRPSRGVSDLVSSNEQSPLLEPKMTYMVPTTLEKLKINDKKEKNLILRTQAAFQRQMELPRVEISSQLQQNETANSFKGHQNRLNRLNFN